MNWTGEVDPTSRRSAQLAVLLGLSLTCVGAMLPLIPEQYRPVNFAPFGAVGLFLAARAGRFALPWSLALVSGGKLIADLLNCCLVHPRDSHYLPSWPVYLSLVIYALMGWLFLQQSESYLKKLGTTALAGIPFFLITNALAWFQQALPYPPTFDGLLQAYIMGLPFHWMTLASDLAFSGLLFAVLAELTTDFAKDRQNRLAPLEVRA